MSMIKQSETKSRTTLKLISLVLFPVFLIAAGCNNTKNNSGQNKDPALQTDSIPNISENQSPATPYVTPLHVGTNIVKVELARTDQQKEQGLSGRNGLQDNEGMLFIFDKPLTAGFWMKGMKFNLDLIWMRNNKIIGITENLIAPSDNTPNSQLEIYYPPSSIDQVLEVKSGWSLEHNIKVGDEVSL